MDMLEQKINERREYPAEEEQFEFKDNWYNETGIAEYISALSNVAAMHGEENAYLVWGVHNDTHELTGTLFLLCMVKEFETLKRFADENKAISRIMLAEYSPYIVKCNNDLSMIITPTEIKFNMLNVFDVFPKVRDKLLDILRYLEKQIGNLDDLDIDLSSKSKDGVLLLVIKTSSRR